jgi:DNA-binding NarL/FixJ family response regulator
VGRHRDEKTTQGKINSKLSRTHSAKRALTTTFNGDAPANSTMSPKIESDAASEVYVAMIEKRLLLAECLTRCIKLASGYNVISFPSVESWLEVADTTPVSLIVLCLGSKPSDAETRRDVSLLLRAANRLPTIILSDVEDPDQIIDVLEQGVRGYIPTSVSLQVAIKAMQLVQAGGVFVPASSLMAATSSSDGEVTSKNSQNGLFTARQAAVVEALRRGKANKIIAYELNMRESTVKVHVRNIMKKLKAKNRTEVAFMTNGAADSGTHFASPRATGETRPSTTVISAMRKGAWIP